MNQFDIKTLNRLYRPGQDSHKGQNGKLLVIGGSNLFHSASMWSLEVASRIVDMVFYSSVPVNEAIVRKQKERFHDGIIVPKNKLTEYIDEADCVLIGPGMERDTATRKRVNDLLSKYPDKKWVIDGGALQVMDKKLLNSMMIITPHHKEYQILFGAGAIEAMAGKFGCTIVLKGKEDVICNQTQCVVNKTGNEGMTKGGTGDVLAGLIAALYCKNDAFLAAACGTYLNGLAGDRLYTLVGPYFNASDLVKDIPKVMAEVL
ncbi:MAG: NAD(P)H-hydrate dehydratase [Patescibacteria group bacterium]|nr:NAD(P)H-hydrate dehydratase [Candidatus Beckwithbacteria bacterium]MDZ4229115.1 NAD(P)H-hydrate dehydratase [Patescibacteria group bacterium]